MFSLRTTRACALFFVQIFPSLFSAIAVFWSFKERRERERVEEEKKSVCKLLKSFMNERIGAKKGKTRCSHIHSRHFPFFFLSYSCSLLLFISVIASACLDSLEFWFYQNLLSASLSLSSSLSIYINNCDRLVYTGRNMLLNQVLFLSLLKNIMLCLFSLICSLINCYHPPPPPLSSLWEVHCYSVEMMSSKKEASLSLLFYVAHDRLLCL
jgi:hypothetical protein